ncbi:MAG TPA: hypothetical protein VJV22_16910, partial [Acidobacteriaceae bacterium]|nr:hypothetical protein [Acidobacteriaceae bacterium]
MDLSNLVMKLRRLTRLPWIAALVMSCVALPLQAASDSASLLRPENYYHYVIEFSRQEIEATGKPGADPWPWMKANIPWFDSSAKDFEEMYYFR